MYVMCVNGSYYLLALAMACWESMSACKEKCEITADWTGADMRLTWSVILSRGTQQDQIIPPLQRSIALAPANTQDRLRPHSYWAPEYQQKLGTTAETEKHHYQYYCML